LIRTDVAIVGAGLSGLYAALLLSRAGTSCVVLEARDRIGGRILSVSAEPPSDADIVAGARYDLGPAWFWPDMQPLMRQMVAELGLAAFPQEFAGAVLVERFKLEPPQRYERGLNTEPRSMRLIGGMQSLADAVAARVPPGTVHLGVRVMGIELDGLGSVRIDTLSACGPLTVMANSVILALPPRIVSGTITFSPKLPSTLHNDLEAIPTWMAGHAKVMAVYDTPFWREQGLSGTASSFVGPLIELHDASAPDGRPALFGFVGLPAASRKSIGPEKLKHLALAQLTRLFGPQAEQPVAVFVVDWAVDPWTATTADGEPPSGHPDYGPPPRFGGEWDGRLVFAGTEVATEYGGYLEGALKAAIDASGKVKGHAASTRALSRGS
jgi:monoamine oxidase